MAEKKQIKRPSYHILVSLIEIWPLEDPKNPCKEPSNPMLLAEVENIEIEDSYRKLIGTASVRFPRGTIIRKTLDAEATVSKDVQVSINLDDNGTVEETRGSNTRAASVQDFQVGHRIRISLGYITHEQLNVLDFIKISSNGKTIWNDTNTLSEYRTYLTKMFDGYITKCSIDTPIELFCENLASGLKKKTCPKVTAKKNMTVSDFLSEDGTYKLLEGSGLKSHPDTKSKEINIGKVNLTTDLTVADVLTEWGKYKVFAYVCDDNEGNACIKVGRSYFSDPKKDAVQRQSIAKAQEDEKQYDCPNILFDYNVADNGLTLMASDKAFLAVEATSLGKDDKFYHMTIRRNPEWTDDKPVKDKWQVLNETKLSKKAMKLGATPLSKSKDKVDLSLYTVIPYMSQKIGISKEDLLEEAIKYFESYNMNGIEGSLTLFGDFPIISGIKVHLTDNQHKAKNGYYLVDEVTTKFGTGGYRQTIKLPYCIARDKDEEKKDGK